MKTTTMTSMMYRLFGEELSHTFCETVATAMLGQNTYAVFSHEPFSLCKWDTPEWFSDHYNFDNFDYILMVARKGASTFRTFLRVIAKMADNNGEKERFNKFAKKVILLNTRTTVFDEFSNENKGKRKMRILIIDDLLGRGRNALHAVRDMYRMGFEPENIFYTALGFNQSQAKQGDFEKSRVTRIIKKETDGTYWLEFNPSELRNNHGSDDFKKYERIRLFLPYSLAHVNADFFNSTLFLHKCEMNFRSQRFIRFMKFASQPYTAYAAYAIIRKNSKLFSRLKFDDINKNGNERVRRFDAPVTEDVDFPEENESVSYLTVRACSEKTSYFSGIQARFNDETDELSIYPRIFLPSLTAVQLREIYVKLFSVKKIDLENVNPMMKLVYAYAERPTDATFRVLPHKFNNFDWESIEYKQYADDMQAKHIYEHMGRIVSLVLAALAGMEFAQERGLRLDDAASIFAESVARYLIAHKHGASAIAITKELLKNCRINVEGAEIFDFTSARYENDMFIEGNWETTWANYLKDTVNPQNFEAAATVVNDYLHGADEKDKNLIAHLSEIQDLISRADEDLPVKISPVPLCVMKNIVLKRCNGTTVDRDTWYEDFIFAVFSLLCAGSIGVALYSESDRTLEKRESAAYDDILSFQCCQCAELSILDAVRKMKDYGGWMAVNALRSIYNYAAHIDEARISVLKKLYARIDCEIENAKSPPDPHVVKDIKDKIDYFFHSPGSFGATGISDRAGVISERCLPKDDPNRPLLNAIVGFEWGYVQ
ncbi:MAG: hypothetical protein FWF80_05850 [Defluviitaleaceae bacterium]|nr:hypothetical protein [Defluviitaleaceae bacterium]